MAEGGIASTEPSYRPLELSLPIENNASYINLHVSDLASKTLLLFVNTGIQGAPVSSRSEAAPGGGIAHSASLGSFVYALPSRSDPKSALSTPLYIRESTIDSITRMAKMLAVKLQRPVYVGGDLPAAGLNFGANTEGDLGGFREGLESLEDEMRAMRRVVDVVVASVQQDA